MRELSLDNCRLDKRYDIQHVLGRGSYAEIFVAHDILAATTSPHKCVVIKALNVFLQDDLDADLERTLVENFQNEAIALDRVRHPNIISRLGHGTARDLRGTVFHYLVLEYMAGGDMQSLIRKEKLPIQRALGYIEQVCAGLAHAHRLGRAVPAPPHARASDVGGAPGVDRRSPAPPAALPAPARGSAPGGR